eukprot:TRINITY_DN6403_c0_g1_i29.p3 TRINITY_DN6403_c0_g1~~TRINITY_DN6403_c0_g1_i29.p3  ORF type:complete len:108 (+),score=11.99 TRINITY_DN6403_c0_g1_i29:3-326(+)
MATTTITPAELKGRKIGRVLTKMGVVTREQIHEALAVQKTRKAPLGKILVEMEYCTDRDISAALAGQAGMEYNGWRQKINKEILRIGKNRIIKSRSGEMKDERKNEG